MCGTDRWDGATDLAETTPSNWRGGDWRVSTADGLGLGGNSGQRRSSKGIAGAQSASQLYANNHFRSSLRMYPHSGGDIRSQQDMLLDNATGNVSILRDPVFTEPVHEITANRAFFRSLRDYGREEEEGRGGWAGSSAARSRSEHAPIW